MSRSFRRETAKKLQAIINTEKDPTIVIEAANALAKYLPKPKTPKRRSGTPVAPIKKEPTLNELIVAMEKKHKEAARNAGSAEGALRGGEGS